jgi:hypothetical protein
VEGWPAVGVFLAGDAHFRLRLESGSLSVSVSFLDTLAHRLVPICPPICHQSTQEPGAFRFCRPQVVDSEAAFAESAAPKAEADSNQFRLSKAVSAAYFQPMVD